MDTMLIVIQKILKFFLTLASFVLIPILRIRSCFKRKYLPPVQNKILLLSATEIAKRIRTKQLSSQEVVEAYIDRCTKVNPVLNAIVESRFEAAVKEAREVDVFLKLTSKTEEELATEMPLLGVPITVKQSIAVKGMNYCVGVKGKSCKADEDAATVKLVRKAGAIVILISNTPELCMSWETYNKVTGTTRNPYDTNRSSGGSSGGEAALLASAASVLSLASDIAGSARIPAMFCGIFGHKPSPGWVSPEGHKPSTDDKKWPMYFTIGSMVRYAEDLPLIMKVISQSEEARHTFGRKVSPKDINFFYVEDYGPGITNSPDRETKLAIRKLKKYVETMYGTTVQKARMNELKFAFNMSAYILLKIDGVETIFSKEDNPGEWRSVMLEVLRYLFFMSPHTFPPLFYGMMKYIVDRLPKKYHNKMVEKKAALKKEFQELLGDNGVLICPTFTSTAFYPLETFHNIGNFTFPMIYNALGMPVTQCPLGLNSKDLPLGVQIVANPGCDHLCISVAQEIEKGFGGWKEPSGEKIV